MRGATDKRGYKVDILLVSAEEIERRVRRDCWHTIRRALWRSALAMAARLRRRQAVQGRSGLGRT